MPRARAAAGPDRTIGCPCQRNSPALGFFRWFAAEPAYDGESGAGRCIWFVDLRFETPGRSGTPFQYGACRDGQEWHAYERTSGLRVR